MKDLIFDVMLNGRFICTLKYRFLPVVPDNGRRIGKVR